MLEGGYPELFSIEHLERFLTKYFNAKVNLYACMHTDKSFGFIFTGRGIYFTMEIKF